LYTCTRTYIHIYIYIPARPYNESAIPCPDKLTSLISIQPVRADNNKRTCGTSNNDDDNDDNEDDDDDDNDDNEDDDDDNNDDIDDEDDDDNNDNDSFRRLQRGDIMKSNP
jgi:hypothetical protein